MVPISLVVLRRCWRRSTSRYIYIYIERERESYIYIYIERERDREIERQIDR